MVVSSADGRNSHYIFFYDDRLPAVIRRFIKLKLLQQHNNCLLPCEFFVGWATPRETIATRSRTNYKGGFGVITLLPDFFYMLRGMFSNDNQSFKQMHGLMACVFRYEHGWLHPEQNVSWKLRKERPFLCRCETHTNRNLEPLKLTIVVI